MRTQQQTKPNTGAKEIQQVNPSGPDKQPKHQAPTIPPTDKSFDFALFKLLQNFEKATFH